jgi:Protein of unknown function (DUF5663)
MAVVIDESWLKQQGVDVPHDEVPELVDLTMDELEMRVGYEIANQLTDEEIGEFEKIDDEDKRVEWLDKALPTYPEIVDEKVEELAKEVGKSKDKTATIRGWADKH